MSLQNSSLSLSCSFIYKYSSVLFNVSETFELCETLEAWTLMKNRCKNFLIEVALLVLLCAQLLQRQQHDQTQESSQNRNQIFSLEEILLQTKLNCNSLASVMRIRCLSPGRQSRTRHQNNSMEQHSWCGRKYLVNLNLLII